MSAHRVDDRCIEAMRKAKVFPFQDGPIYWQMPQVMFEQLKAELRDAGVPVVSKAGEPPTHETRLYGFPIVLSRRFRLVTE